MASSFPPVGPAVTELYTTDAERRWEYRESVFRAEGYATRAVLTAALPQPPARVVDIGGGSGRWAQWLASRGHEVALADVVPAAVDEARARDASLGRRLASIELADARCLPWETSSAQAALLFGPLYHLHDRTERLRALSEAARVVAPGGVVVVQLLTRTGALRSLLRLTGDINFDWRRLLRDGVVDDPSAPGLWRATYWQQPEEAARECGEAGLAVEVLRGVDGPAPDAQAGLVDAPEAVVERWGELALELGSDLALIATAATVLVVARVMSLDSPGRR